MTATGLIDFGYGEGKTYAQLVLYGKRPTEAAGEWADRDPPWDWAVSDGNA
jgi:hypothetical protein